MCGDSRAPVDRNGIFKSLWMCCVAPFILQSSLELFPPRDVCFFFNKKLLLAVVIFIIALVALGKWERRSYGPRAQWERWPRRGGCGTGLWRIVSVVGLFPFRFFMMGRAPFAIPQDKSGCHW